jgi:hypothetical protein
MVFSQFCKTPNDLTSVMGRLDDLWIERQRRAFSDGCYYGVGPISNNISQVIGNVDMTPNDLLSHFLNEKQCLPERVTTHT